MSQCRPGYYRREKNPWTFCGRLRLIFPLAVMLIACANAIGSQLRENLATVARPDEPAWRLKKQAQFCSSRIPRRLISGAGQGSILSVAGIFERQSRNESKENRRSDKLPKPKISPETHLENLFHRKSLFYDASGRRGDAQLQVGSLDAKGRQAHQPKEVCRIGCEAK